MQSQIIDLSIHYLELLLVVLFHFLVNGCGAPNLSRLLRRCLLNFVILTDFNNGIVWLGLGRILQGEGN